MIEGRFLIFALIIPTISHALVSNHSFIFVTGWPQSGTSFIHQLLSQNQQSISSMIKLCEKILGSRRCQSWNHEGQWMIDGKLRDVIDAGNICPVESINDESKKQAILAQLSRFWLLDKPYLIEKSPQNFVKIPMLQDLFAGSKSIKVIVVLKHPVTLNIATLKETSWRYRKITDDFPLLPGQVRQTAQPEYRELTNIEIHNNFQHFIELMTHKVNTSQVQDCSLGWLPAMTYLHHFLQNNRDFSDKNIRIIRFERLVKPVSVCLDLFHFIFEEEFSVHKNHVTKICQRYLANAVSGSSGSQPDGLNRGKGNQKQTINQKMTTRGKPAKRSRRQLQYNNASKVFNTSDADRRQLRFRPTRESASFTFRAELVKENGVKRIQEFASVFQQYYLAKNVHQQIVQINQQLSNFGYQLTSFYPNTQKNLFEPWELKPYREKAEKQKDKR